MGTDLVPSKIEVDDLSFSTRFGTKIGDDYRQAVEVMMVFPEYALLKYRQVLEQLSAALCKLHKIPTDHYDSLHVQINELCHQGRIDDKLKSKFHELRIMTNRAVHKTPISEGDLEQYQVQEYKQEFISERNKQNKEVQEKAIHGRALLFEILKACSADFRYIKLNETLYMANLEHLELRQLVFNALNSQRAHEKFLGGKAIEKILSDQEAKSGTFIASYADISHRKSQLKIASSFYRAAIEIDAELDDLDTGILLDNAKVEQYQLSRSKAEYLFHFADIAVNEDLGEELYKEGFAALEVAVKKSFTPAIALLGAKHYFDENYSNALNLLITAFQSDNALAARFLFYYYSEGKACNKDPFLAKKYIEKACELDCTDSMLNLAMDYSNGNTFGKNIEKAKYWMNLAAEKGNLRAKLGYDLFFGNSVQKITTAFTDNLMKALDEANEGLKSKPLLVGQKLGVNEPCHCGSGKKYKKCCRN
jgi:TPR repeat protein